MFWGLIMEPHKRYTQVVERPFHVSQAAMDISTGDNDPCQVMIVVDGKNFLACTLQKSKQMQVPLDLCFKTGDNISFLTNGKCNVHLTGYHDPDFDDEPSDEEEEDEEDSIPALVPAKNKRKLETSNEKPSNKKAKKAAVAEDSDDESDGEDQLQKLLAGDDIETDENDETFASADASDSDEEDTDEEEEKEGAEEEADSDAEEAETTLDTSAEEKLDMSKLSKSAKRRLKKKLQQQAKQQSPQVNGVDKPKKDKQDKADKKKEGKKETAGPEASGEKKEKKSLSGGVFIEDLKVGSGPAAKPGKSVTVYYEGRLKQNNKMFDNCLKGPGFKFRLGSKEVISGWDVGVAGMKVGGKRKIICPPAMAYGAKGSPPTIPPNSTLVFEVELKQVK